MNKQLSAIFRWLRFPLATMIVLKHYYTPDISAEFFSELTRQDYTIYYYVGKFFSDVFTSMMVPIFFFMSGYLYFVNVDIKKGLGRDVWKSKTRSRIKTLLVPYLCWYLLVLIFFAITQYLSGNSEVMAKDGYKWVIDYQFVDYVKAFVALDSTTLPIDGPLWFIRNLFVIAVFFTPILSFMFSKNKDLTIVILLIAYFAFRFNDVMEYTMASVFFFSLGGYMSVRGCSMLVDRNDATPWVCLAVICVTMTMFFITHFYYPDAEYYPRGIFLICSSCLVYPFIGRVANLEVNSLMSRLSVSSFFIFGIHKPLQVIVRRLTFAILHPSDELMLTLLVVVIPMIVVCISLLIFYIIKRYMPYLSFLNGYRL